MINNKTTIYFLLIIPMYLLYLFQPEDLSATEKIQSPNEVLESAPNNHWRTPNPENLLYIELATGRIIIELAPQFSPGHVNNVKLLAKEGFYDNASFYRVVNGFVAQGGAGKNKRSPIKGKIAIVAEFTKSIDDQFKYMEISGPDGYAKYSGFKSGFPINLNNDKTQVWITHCTGIFAMARGDDVNSGGTEFYITLNNQRHLDSNATVFGSVLYGMHLAQRLKRSTSLAGPIDMTGENLIKSIKVAADIPLNQRIQLEVMDTESESFAKLIKARKYRTEKWFVARPDYVDVCNVNVPVRLKNTRK
jgi:peptidylprolyl isomerase